MRSYFLLGDTAGRRDGKQNSLSLHIKRFATTTFYLKGGLDYIKIKEDYTYTSLSPVYDYGFEADRLGFTVAIGLDGLRL